ncbi:MAG: PTS sugar transporter subunit IIA [Gammaproteobacteria bacterium]|nr:PTS sugar transporter subunit IIA [Gammaproteobacteria bacterium]
MELATLIDSQRVRCGADVTSKKRSLELLSELLTDDLDTTSARAVFEGLTLRERLGSTGLGHGVALPHSRGASIEAPRAAVIRLEKPIDFDAVDKEPVDLIFALLVPESSNDEHLRILARLAEMFRDTAFCARLRACRSNTDLHSSLIEWQSQNAG